MKRLALKHTVGLLALALMPLASAVSQAQFTTSGVSTQFTVTGILQAATCGAWGASPQFGVGTPPQFAGGALLVNGMNIVVPDNTIVQYPAFSSTWRDVFNMAPGTYTGVSTGLATSDNPGTTYEVTVIGNRVGDTYIAGLITFSQESLNAGQGFINYIDYANAEMWVGGALWTQTGTRVRINDPVITNPLDVRFGKGRHSRGQSPDARFTCDQENPTIRSVTGYPMGLPAIAADPYGGGAIPRFPAIAGLDDPFCPQSNRPLDGLGSFTTNFTMNAPGAASRNPMMEAPFEVGDYIDYSGTLITDNAFVANPSYISAHTIIDNVAIYTLPGVDPAFVAIDVTILGTGGIGAAGVTEATARTRFEGFTTDQSRNIHILGIDLDPKSNQTDRDWGFSAVDQGPPTGAAKGRWRFRPPSKILIGPSGGSYTPTTREVRAVLTGAFGMPDSQAATVGLSGNGIPTGRYHAPINTYLFPEQIPGSAIPPCNFETFFWLAQGGQMDSTSGMVAGQLYPWPGATPPVPANGPTVSAGSNQNVNTPTPIPVTFNVTLTGTATVNRPATFIPGVQWTQVSGPTAGVAMASPAAATTTVALPSVPFGGDPVVRTFQYTATDDNGKSASSNMTVQVNAPLAKATVVAITAVAQRNPKIRLDVTANSTGNGTDQLFCTTIGATINTTGQMTWTPSLLTYTITFIGNGQDATSVKVTSSGGGTATMANNNPLWKIR
jgi:hypothetical protein